MNIDRLYEYDRLTSRALRDQDLNSADWEKAERAAFSFLEKAENSVFRFNFDDVDGVTERPITACGLILWSAAQRKLQVSIAKNNDEMKRDAIFVALKASAAFLYAANVATAYAIGRKVKRWITDQEDFAPFLDILVILNDFSAASTLQADSDDFKVKLVNYYRQLMQIRLGDLSSLTATPPSISDFLVETRNLHSLSELPVALGSLAYSFQTSIEWLSRQLSVHVLDLYFRGFPQWESYRSGIEVAGPHFLFPSQRIAFQQLANCGKHDNVILNFPTSAGKTFIGEMLAVEPLLKQKSGLAVVLVPLRALVGQYRNNRHLKLRLRKAGIRFIAAMGGYMDDLPTISQTERLFMVATPEAFDYAWRNIPAIRLMLTSATIDEFQLIEQAGRGANLECICSNFLDSQDAGQLNRITMLSAVVDDTERLQQWMRVPDSAVIRTRWVPTTKRFEAQAQDNSAHYLPEPFADSSSIRLSNWHFSSGAEKLLIGNPLYSVRKEIQASVNTTVARLALFAAQLLQGTILVLCKSRNTSRRIAKELAHAPVNEDAIPPEVAWERDRLIYLLTYKYPHFQTLLAAVRKRACYHNAGLPSEIKELLESLIAEEYFDVVASTTTLAEGVNLPFRGVILESWVWSDEGTFFNPLLVRNIAGRAGRAGYYVEGDTIFADNVLSSNYIGALNYIETLLFTTKVALQSSLANFEQLQNEVAQGGQKKSKRTPSSEQAEFLSNYGRIQSFLAEFISRTGTISNASEFVQRLYVSHFDSEAKHKIADALEKLIQVQVARPQWPLLAQNSPVRVTPLGEISIKTGLSLESASAVIDAIASLKPSKYPRANSLIARHRLDWDPWLQSIFDELRRINELQGSWLRAAKSDSVPVNEANVDNLFWTWFSGWSTPAMLHLIKYRGPVNNHDWVWPLNESDTSLRIESQIIELERFCDEWFSYYWTWVLRSVAKLAQTPELSGQAPVDFRYLAQQVKYGVNGRLPVNIMSHREYFPGTRTHAQILDRWARNTLILMKVESIPQLVDSGRLPEPQELTRIALDSSAASIATMDQEMAERICEWLAHYEFQTAQNYFLEEP